jgi:threonine/homoserine/homoserine lactone efflux protein
VGDLSLFIVAALVLAITPGPAVLYIVTRSISQGRAAGIVSCFGVALGGMIHVLAAALGLSSILMASAVAFTVLKYVGALYLIWLGVRKLAARPTLDAPQVGAVHSLWRVGREGFVVNLLNPKTALFFLAFLPQFVEPARGQVAAQFAFLGSLFLAIACCTDTMWALVASGAGTWLKRHPRFVSSERYMAGGVYLGLGLATAFSSAGRK